MNLFAQVEHAHQTVSHAWTTTNKAQIMAAAILTLRPKYSLEIGCWFGAGLVPMGIAHAHVGSGIAIGVDPYDPAASIVGQTPEHEDWWKNVANHEAAYEACKSHIMRFCPGHAKLHRVRSEEFEPPAGIGVLRIDGNHSDVAVKDVERYTPSCEKGAILFLDDLNWPKGGVIRAGELAREMGWVEMYDLDDGKVFRLQ